MHVFYCENIQVGIVELNNEESLHATKVLRLKAGESVQLINGLGVTAQAEILQTHDKHTRLKINTITQHAPHQTFLHLAVAPNKNADRLEWLLEKITELGADEFTPIISARTIRNKIRMERMQKIILSAAKQSLNPWPPKINEPIGIEKFIEKTMTLPDNPTKIIAHCLQNSKIPLKKAFESSESKHCICLIGPEGDFNAEEIQFALSKGFQEITMGQQRLRTETAAIYAAAAFKLISGY